MLYLDEVLKGMFDPVGYPYVLAYFFVIICLVGAPFYCMLRFFIHVLKKICKKMNKKSIHLISFAIPALIYSLALPLIMGTSISFRLCLGFLLLGLIPSIPFYVTLWYFLGIFQRVLPNRSNKLTQLVSIHFISFATTALIFSLIPLMLAFFARSGYEDDHKNGTCWCQKM
jgi:hypothetical protein